ncbi:MAG: hypothetical protein SPH85_11990, partial [Bacteroidales bacterium]|nr:hypothetical protein [Bacteroidales bacterium]
MGNVSRGAACCASIPMRQEKTAGKAINIFVILLVIIGLCEMSLRIDNSFGTNFTDYTGNASRGAACCASILPRQEKTAKNIIILFVILLIVIGLCETSLRIDNSFGTDFTDYTGNVSRGVACCASIPKHQEKTTKNIKIRRLMKKYESPGAIL